MNKEIEKFWTSLNYYVIKYEIRDHIYFVVSNVPQILNLKNKVALIPGDREIEYFFLDSPKAYSEKEMIQLVRLRAFL